MIIVDSFSHVFDKSFGKYIPQYLAGELSLNEAFEKIEDDIFDAMKIDYEDKEIFIIPAKDKPVKVVFENPLDERLKNKMTPLFK